MKSLTNSLYALPQTVFTLKEIALILGVTDVDNLKSRINYFVRKGDLIPLRRGIYAKYSEYNPFELATKIFTPAYISLETVLRKEGVIFQYYEKIFVVSYQTREIEVDGHVFSFRKIKTDILLNSMGMVSEEGVSMASKERAFLDILYLNTNYYFDNLRSMDWKKIREMAPMYGSQSLTERIKEYEHKSA